MKPKLSRRLRSRHRYSVLLAQETTHLHSLCSVVVRVCTRIRKGHWTASRRLLKDDTGHQVIRHAQRQQRVGTAALNMCVKWFSRLENPKQSQSWRTGNSLFTSLQGSEQEVPRRALYPGRIVWKSSGLEDHLIRDGRSRLTLDRRNARRQNRQGSNRQDIMHCSSCPVWWTQYKQTNPANSISRQVART